MCGLSLPVCLCVDVSCRSHQQDWLHLSTPPPHHLGTPETHQALHPVFVKLSVVNNGNRLSPISGSLFDSLVSRLPRVYSQRCWSVSVRIHQLRAQSLDSSPACSRQLLDLLIRLLHISRLENCLIKRRPSFQSSPSQCPCAAFCILAWKKHDINNVFYYMNWSGCA